jgi:ribonuclease VapC
MIVVDSSIIVAIIREENDSARFVDILNSTEAIMPAVAYVETHMVVAGRNSSADSREVDGIISDLGVKVVDLTPDQANAAVWAFLRYGKGRHRARLNFVDCFCYALAKSRGVPLLFKGDDFAKTDIVPAWPP